MPLVNCPECGNSIAADAQECPHCGHLLKKQKVEIQQPLPPARNYGWGSFLYVLIIIAGLFMLFEGRLAGLLLLILGILLIIGRYKLWAHIGKRIK